MTGARRSFRITLVLSGEKKVDPALRKGSALSTERMQANSEKKEWLPSLNKAPVSFCLPSNIKYTERGIGIIK